MGAKHRDDFVRSPGGNVETDAGFRREKSWQLASLISDHWDTKRLESLPRRGQVENGLGAGADDEHRRPCELDEIRGFIKWRITVNAANSARGEYTDSVWGTSVRQHERRRDGRRTVGTLRDRGRNIARRDFAHTVTLEKSLELIGVEPNRRHAFDHRRDRGNGTRSTNGAQHSLRRIAIVRNREPLRQDGALERDDWHAAVECPLDLRKNPHERLQ